jgi:Domain of unknown function (DUF4388)
MAFQGSLAELHLPDIIQLVSVSGKTGVFHLTDGVLRGQIYLVDGKIVHAQLEDALGEEAVYALSIWRQGEFRFDQGAASEARTITKSNTNLLMEAARRLDEWRVLAKKIAHVDLVPEFVVQENREGQINLNTSEWLILSKIDGHRSVKSIAQSANLSVFDAAKMLYGLIATNLIRLHEPPAEAVPVAPPAKPAAPTVASGPGSKPPPLAGAPAAPPKAPPPRAAAARDSAPSQQAVALVAKLTRVRDDCINLLGPVGETVVNKHYHKARTEIERGAGTEVIEEAVHQIARAAAILKGPSASETILEHLKGLR